MIFKRKHKIPDSKVFRTEGFTMIELVIVFVIIGILAVIGVPNYKRFQANQSLKESVQQIETELGKAFSSARSHPEHFGLKLTEGSHNEIELFKINPQSDTEQAEDISSFELGKGIEIQDDAFEIVFLRPYGDIREESDTTLSVKSPIGKSVTIHIQPKSGLITHETNEE
jgi:prepilin-type N-terminal cleavage/methylation domain-containing protein